MQTVAKTGSNDSVNRQAGEQQMHSLGWKQLSANERQSIFRLYGLMCQIHQALKFVDVSIPRVCMQNATFQETFLCRCDMKILAIT